MTKEILKFLKQNFAINDLLLSSIISLGVILILFYLKILHLEILKTIEGRCLLGIFFIFICFLVLWFICLIKKNSINQRNRKLLEYINNHNGENISLKDIYIQELFINESLLHSAMCSLKVNDLITFTPPKQISNQLIAKELILQMGNPYTNVRITEAGKNYLTTVNK